MSPAARPPLYLLDASLYVFRAWHSMPDESHDADGWPTNAVHGFARFLLDVLEDERPRHVVVAFDEAHDNCFRTALFPAYKANRPPAPDTLKRQFAYCRTLCMVLGLPVLTHPRYEADDLIGTALAQGRAVGHRGVIVSADKDLSQLLGPGDEQWDFARGLRWGPDGVHARHGVYPEQVPDFLALCGDASDNIPGVPGVGARTAAALLAHFGSLDALLGRVDEVPFLRLRGATGIAARLREHREQALLYRRLATVACDAPLAGTKAPFARGQADAGALPELCRALGFGPMTRRRLHEASGLPFAAAGTEVVA